MATEAAAQGWLGSLTFNWYGGCAAAVCTNSKKGYKLLWQEADVSVIFPATEKRHLLSNYMMERPCQSSLCCGCVMLQIKNEIIHIDIF